MCCGRFVSLVVRKRVLIRYASQTHPFGAVAQYKIREGQPTPLLQDDKGAYKHEPATASVVNIPGTMQVDHRSEPACELSLSVPATTPEWSFRFADRAGW